MSEPTPPRARRGTFTAVPRATTISGRIETSLRNLVEAPPSLEYYDSDRNITYAPFELLVYRTSDGELVYRPSYLASLPGEREHPTAAETHLTTAFDYMDLTADPYWTPDSLFTEHACQPEAGTLLELRPRGHGSTATDADSVSYPSMVPGVGLAMLVQMLDRTNTQWAIQLVCAGLGMTLRVLLDTTSTADGDWDLTPITSLDTTESAHPLSWLQPVNQTDEETAMLFRNALLKDGTTFTPPIDCAKGFLYPPARKQSLRATIGGTASGLENGPAAKISPLIDPPWTVGVESTFRTSEQFSSRLHLGPPELPAAVLRVASSETLQHVENMITDALQSDRPTIVISSDSTVIRNCASLYCDMHRDDSTADDVVTPERVTGHALSPFLTPDRITELRPWFSEMLTGPATLYLIDLSDSGSLGAPVAESTALLLSELSNAGYALDDTAPQCVGHVSVLTPTLLSETTAHHDRVERVLRKTSEHRLAVDIATTYSATQSNRDGWESLTRSADIVMAANDGQSAPFVQDRRLSAADQTLTEQVMTNGGDVLWNTRIDLPHWKPFILPLHKLAATDATTAPAKTTLHPNQETALDHVLSSFATIEIPDVGVNTNVSAHTGLAETASSSLRERTHIPRRTALPPAVEYDDDRHCYTCVQCLSDDEQNATRRDVTVDGLRAALTCCGSLDDVDRNALRRMPDPALKVTENELEASDLSLNHFKFLKGLYLVETEDVDPYFEYDPLRDSGTKLRDDYDLTTADIELLKDRGYITKDTDPHIIYTLTPAGRRYINEPWKQDHEFGTGIRELNDTLQHYTMVRGAELDYKARFADDPELTVETYVPIEVPKSDGDSVTKNIDVAVLDTDGNIIHATEAERRNRDQDESVVETYQKLRAADPATARWVVPDADEAVALLDDLATKAAAGEIDYSGTTYPDDKAPARMELDEPGITDVEVIRNLKQDATDNNRY